MIDTKLRCQRLRSNHTLQILASLILVTVVGAIFLRQQSQGSQLRQQLDDATSRRTLLEQQSATALAAYRDQLRHGEDEPTLPSTIRSLLAAAEGPIDAQMLMKSLTEVFTVGDIVGMIRIFLPIVSLSAEDYDRLLADVQNQPGNEQIKEACLQMLGSFAPSDDPRKSLERMIALEMEPYSYASLIAGWAGKDPDAALAWLQEKRAAGDLLGKGIHDTPDQVLVAQLIAGTASTDPSRAIDLFQQMTDDESSNRIFWQLSAALAAQMKESGDDSHFQRLLSLPEAASARAQILQAALPQFAGSDGMDAGAAFVEKYAGGDSDARQQAMLQLATNQQSSLPLAERAAWLAAKTPEAQQSETMRHFIQQSAWRNTKEITEWVDSQPPGAVRDQGPDVLSANNASRGNFDTALAQIAEIQDDELRAEARRVTIVRWVTEDPEKARESIPPDLLEAALPGN